MTTTQDTTPHGPAVRIHARHAHQSSLRPAAYEIQTFENLDKMLVHHEGTEEDILVTKPPRDGNF